jgi:hypothetical protein
MPDNTELRMSWDDVCHYIAQGAINIDCGHAKIQQGSAIHRAMTELCELLSEGKVIHRDQPLARVRGPHLT